MLNIKFSKEKPPIYEKLKVKFGISWDKGIIICYGDTIHCKYDVTPEKIVHECEHVKQQEKIGKDLWWQFYLERDTFRLEQEVEAYRAEYQFLKKYIKNRETVYKLLREMAHHMASETYGNLVDLNEAIKLIKS